MISLDATIHIDDPKDVPDGTVLADRQDRPPFAFLQIGTFPAYVSVYTSTPAVLDRIADEAADLAAKLRAAERSKVADPAYTPTVAEALRNPAEFVAGMTCTEELHHADLGENGAG